MIKIVNKRKYYFTLSTVIILITFACAMFFGVNLDIQFKGGMILNFSYQGTVDQSTIKQDFEKQLGMPVSIQSSQAITGNENSLIISTTESIGVTPEKLTEIADALIQLYPDNAIKLVSSNSVNPAIGKEFFAKSLVAVAFAAVIMIIYISLRFKVISGWSAGLTAVIALIHDLLIVFATFVLFNIPINANFIAVLLTILGYSINDTIVIYDRIRENKKIFGNKLSVEELVDKSINQTLGRSLTTTISTVLAMVVVSVMAVIFHVESILSFSFPMIIGMISGVYSSNCIATPLWVMWEQRKEKS